MVSSAIKVVSRGFSETQSQSQEKDFLWIGENLEQDQAQRVEERHKATQERIANDITDLRNEGRKKKQPFFGAIASSRK